MSYESFLLRKSSIQHHPGFDPDIIPENLFEYQKAIVRWACKRGRAAIFADCGLGKTAMQLTWAANIRGDVIILAPLAVAQQTVAEGMKFGIQVNYCRSSDEVKPGITIANYEMLHQFNLKRFIGVVLDESSILKAFMGKRKRQIVDGFRETPYRLACTATPAPNDHMELGNHADFLGVMASSEMLSKYFINDPSQVGKYRVKGHAQDAFWEWMATWACTISKPSDLGYPDDGFKLPECQTKWHVVDDTNPIDGFLFALPAASMSERIKARKSSVEVRCKFASELTNNGEQWLVYCALNDESEWLSKEITGAVEVRGSMTIDQKCDAISGFINGTNRVLVSKPTICGFGMNFQFCRNVMFVGLSDSWEKYYQAKRRVWRFGQKQKVNCHVVTASTEGAVVDNILRKEADADKLMRELCARMGHIQQGVVHSDIGFKQRYKPTKTINLPSFL